MNQKGQPGSPYKAEISANSGLPPLFPGLAQALADMTDVVYGIHSAGCVRRRTYDPGLIETPDFVCLRPNFHENELQRIRLPSCGSKPRALWKRTVTKWSIWKNVLEQNHWAIPRRVNASQHCVRFVA